MPDLVSAPCRVFPVNRWTVAIKLIVLLQEKVEVLDGFASKRVNRFNTDMWPAAMQAEKISSRHPQLPQAVDRSEYTASWFTELHVLWSKPLRADGEHLVDGILGIREDVPESLRGHGSRHCLTTLRTTFKLSTTGEC